MSTIDTSIGYACMTSTQDDLDYYRDPLSNFWYGPVAGRANYAGETVNDATAISVAAVYACVRVISEGVAGLPLKVFKRNPDGTRDIAKGGEGERLHQLLAMYPNNVQTPFEFWEHALWNLVLRGNFLAVKDNAARPESLSTIATASVEKYKVTPSGMVYEVRQEDGSRIEVLSEDVLHVKGPTRDGYWGMTPIEVLRNPIGLSIAAERFGGSLFKQGVRPSGVFEYPGKLSPEAFARLRSQMNDYSGAANAAKTMLLEEGAKWSQVSMTNEDAQYLELRKFQVTEIARIFRVPPHMIADLEKATFSNIEHMSIEFVVHSLRPWLVRIEKAIQRDLINVTDGSLYVEFITDGLLRGDAASRYNAYALALQNEILTRNEVRELENRNPMDGGDELRNPAINPGGSTGVQPDPVPQQAQAQSGNVLAGFAKHVAGQIATKELKQLEPRLKHATADRKRFNEWAHEAYTEHARHVDRVLEDFVHTAGISEAARVETVQRITADSMRALISADNPERLAEEWGHGALATRIHNTILEVVT